MGFINEKAEDGKWRTIDKEREIILRITRGPHPEYGYEFELELEGNIIKFCGDSGMKIHGNPKLGETRQYDMNWHFNELFIPDAVKREKKEIINFIKEALEVYGDSYRTEKASSVSVEFSPNLI